MKALIMFMTLMLLVFVTPCSSVTINSSYYFNDYMSEFTRELDLYDGNLNDQNMTPMNQQNKWDQFIPPSKPGEAPKVEEPYEMQMIN